MFAFIFSYFLISAVLSPWSIVGSDTCETQVRLNTLLKCSIYIPHLGCLVNQPDVLHAVALRCTCSPLKSSDRCNMNNGLVRNYHVIRLTPKVVLSGLVYTLSLLFGLLCSTSSFKPINGVILKSPLWRHFSGLPLFLWLIVISME